MINYNTYLKLNKAVINAAVSTSKGKGIYKLTKTDLKKGYYVTLTFEGITINYPFKALFKTNKKLDGIPAIKSAFKNQSIIQ